VERARRGQDLRSLFVGLNEKLAAIAEARILVVSAAADSGHRQRGRFRHACPAP